MNVSAQLLTPDERAILESLDEVLRSQSVRELIHPVAERVSRELQTNKSAVMAWKPIPLTAFNTRLPATIRSSWIFILRANSVTGAERHPNSHQRMMSFQGHGDLQMMIGDSWQSHRLTSDMSDPIESRWVSVPPNVWHQAVVQEGDWVVVSFHTVPAEELVEERPAPHDRNFMQQRRYL